MGKVAAVVGAAYGSEGKGNAVKFLANEYDVHVRTGGPNAGHTIYHEGEKWKMRSVPCGWVNPDAKLVIGAGAVVDVDLLQAEVYMLEKAGYEIKSRLYVDRRATVLCHEHSAFEGGVNGDAHSRIGSTGEGVGIARMARMARETVDIEPFIHCPDIRDLWRSNLCTSEYVLRNWMDEGKSVLLEGTQGSALSLTFGPWPFVTSRDTNAAQLAADAGIPPQRITDVILVARTFPIRVAGNSGPLKYETSWGEIGQEPEQTTVTLKTRRVGKWDDALFADAVCLNAPTEVALMFCDYLAEDEAFELKHRIESIHGVKITMMGWGPDEVVRC